MGMFGKWGKRRNNNVKIKMEKSEKKLDKKAGGGNIFSCSSHIGRIDKEIL